MARSSSVRFASLSGRGSPRCRAARTAAAPAGSPVQCSQGFDNPESYRTARRWYCSRLRRWRGNGYNSAGFGGPRHRSPVPALAADLGNLMDFLLNGRTVTVEGFPVHSTLLDYLRG